MSTVSGFFSRVADDVTRFTDKTADTVHGAANPKYKKMKEELTKASKVSQIVGVALLVTATILSVISLATLSVDPLIFAGVVGFVAYNGIQLGANLQHVAKLPAAYQSAYGLGKGLDTEKLTKELSKNTWGMNKYIKDIVNGLDEALKDRQSQRR